MRRFPFHPLLLLSLLLPLLPGCKSDPSAPPPTTPEELLRTEMSRLRLPSLSAIITRGDSIVWSFYGGTVSPSHAVTPDAQTGYILASISKTVTAVAAMQLWERGALELDRDISDYLGFTVRNPHHPQIPLTTRMLLTHATGLVHPGLEIPGFYDLYGVGGEPPLRAWVQGLIVPGGYLYTPAVWKQETPGQVYQYSNIGGAVVGLIVESITGTDFAVYCRDSIFLPLGMQHTSFRATRTDPNVAAIHTSTTTTRPPYAVPFYPSSTLWSTAADFSRFMVAVSQGGSYRGRPILQESTVNTMLTAYAGGGSLRYLWFVYPGGGRGHAGGFVGVSSIFQINRSTQTGFYIVTNIGNINDVYPGGRIHRIVADHAAQLQTGKPGNIMTIAQSLVE